MDVIIDKILKRNQRRIQRKSRKEKLKTLNNLYHCEYIKEKDKHINTLIRYKKQIMLDILQNELNQYNDSRDKSIISMFNSIIRDNTLNGVINSKNSNTNTRSKVDLSLLSNLMKSYPLKVKKSLKEITKMYNRLTTGRLYKEGQIRNKIKEIGYSYHIPSRFDYRFETPKNIQLRQIFINEFSSLLKSGNIFFYIDETYLAEHFSTGKDWVLKGERTKSNKFKKLTTLSAICAVSNTGFRKIFILDKHINSKFFFDFLKELYYEIKDDDIYSKYLLENKIVFLMDNCTFHLDYDNLKFFEERNIKFLFNSPYSPRYTMIENIFQTVKMKMRYYDIATIKKRIDVFSKTFNELDDLVFRSTYCHSISCMIEDLDKIL